MVVRFIWVVAGFTVLIAGVIMIFLPGPAIILIPMGLALLATEYAWARRYLDHFKRGGRKIGNLFKRKSRPQE
jgi:tellurite resistance protein TerC